MKMQSNNTTTESTSPQNPVPQNVSQQIPPQQNIKKNRLTKVLLSFFFLGLAYYGTGFLPLPDIGNYFILGVLALLLLVWIIE
jgi:hypothetical protein